MLLYLVWFYGLICAAYGDENEDIQKSALENPVLFGGDMLGIELDEDRNVKPNVMTRWTNATVPYVIAPGFSNTSDIIEQAFRHYHTTTCVRFVPKTNERSFINIFQGNGCYSNVGMTTGMQSVSLGRGCVNVGTIVHELGHTLGLYHEQNRSDRDDYLEVLLENVMKGMEMQFQKLRPDQNLLLTPFDYDSIMIYGNSAFSVNKALQTMRAKNGQALLDPYRKKGMTASDIKRINMMYNCNKQK